MTDRTPGFVASLIELLHVALPLMISTGTFSIVLFTDRTLLLWFDGASMSASMAAGNLFWLLVCVPIGIVSMSGAIIGQHIGAGEPEKIGRLIWQSVWMSMATLPLFLTAAWFAFLPFEYTNQPPELVPLETNYFRWLMIGAAGVVMETALSGFFAGTERTRVVMWISVLAGLLNVVLNLLLIFGAGPIPAMGITGAAIGSVISFWFKVACYAWLILRPAIDEKYKIWSGFGFDWPVFSNLLFFGFPSGLMSLTEAGAFTLIVLRIGHLGDIPLRATAMAINFNMIAFVPLIGIAIGASVLVGKHLLESGPKAAIKSTMAGLVFAYGYSALWLIAYLVFPDVLISLYTIGEENESTLEASVIAAGLLRFVALYLILDATQLIVAAALKGAGDTWYVLVAGLFSSVVAVGIGYFFEPDAASPSDSGLTWWWWMVTLWIWLLAIAMTIRFIGGRWKEKRMV